MAGSTAALDAMRQLGGSYASRAAMRPEHATCDPDALCLAVMFDAAKLSRADFPESECNNRVREFLREVVLSYDRRITGVASDVPVRQFRIDISRLLCDTADRMAKAQFCREGGDSAAAPVHG